MSVEVTLNEFGNLAGAVDCYSGLILTLATHQERNENTHQEKNKTWSSGKKQDPTVKSQ